MHDFPQRLNCTLWTVFLECHMDWYSIVHHRQADIYNNSTYATCKWISITLHSHLELYFPIYTFIEMNTFDYKLNICHRALPYATDATRIHYCIVLLVHIFTEFRDWNLKHILQKSHSFPKMFVLKRVLL